MALQPDPAYCCGLVSAVHDQLWRDRLLNSSVERYGDAVHAAAENALNYGRGVKEFESMMRALEYRDEEKFWRYCAKWLRPYIDEHSGRRQRIAGKQSPGRRGKNKVAPAMLLAAVKAERARNPRRLTFNDVCRTVARRFGYKSAWSVKRAAAAIKWPDPRSKASNPLPKPR